jgi:Holliday junction resolvasome RuvABC endonuclease subunit
MGFILGLDVSTKTIGVSLFEDKGESGKLLELTHVTPKIKPKPENSLELMMKKVETFEKEFLHKYSDFEISKVFIEEPLLRSNNVNTVGTLLRFNGMICRAVYDVLNIVPEFVSSYDARKYAFPELMAKRTKKKDGTPLTENAISKNSEVLFGGHPFDIDKKMVIWEKVSDREPQIVWLYDKNMKLKKENFDMTDSYAVVLGAMQKLGIWKTEPVSV